MAIVPYKQAFATLRKQYPVKTRRALQKLALEAVTKAVQLTPVDTGRLRGSWTVTLNIPISVYRERFDKDGGATIAAAKAVIGRAKTGMRIHIQNLTPYGAFVEYGTRYMAPRFFVRRTNAFIATRARKILIDELINDITIGEGL